MRFRYYSFFIGIMLIAVACVPQESAAIVRLNTTPAAQISPVVIYVTPTTRPTGVPTISLMSPSPSATPADAATATPNIAAEQVQCNLELVALFTQASEACLGKPDGYFCNGGLPPRAQPAGAINNTMALVGSLVEVNLVERVHSAPLPSNNSGGLLWMRLEEPLAVSALLVGDVHIQNATPADGNYSAWQSIQVQTMDTASDCQSAPYSTLIVQGPYGGIGKPVINGVSVEINGTLAIQTHDNVTEFIELEGRSRLTVFGQGRVMFAGEKIAIQYADGDFSRPLSIPENAEPLVFARIRNLPMMLLDRPVLLPQPGVVYTDGRVNMRSEPNIESQLLFQVPDDQPLSILGENPEGTWYHVRLGNGETGWMRNDLVKGTVGPIESVYDPTPVPPQRYGNAASRAVVIAPNGGNLRRAPDVQFPIIETLAEGTEVELLARSPYSPWVKVDTGAQIGWMALITIETQSVIGFLPVDYDVPLPPGPTATPFFTFGGGHAYPDPRSGQ